VTPTADIPRCMPTKSGHHQADHETIVMTLEIESGKIRLVHVETLDGGCADVGCGV